MYIPNPTTVLQDLHLGILFLILIETFMFGLFGRNGSIFRTGGAVKWLFKDTAISRAGYQTQASLVPLTHTVSQSSWGGRVAVTAQICPPSHRQKGTYSQRQEHAKLSLGLS